jgi:hypothetical protein
MPARSPHVPHYRHYKPKDLAVVRIDGKDHYLGKFGSEVSKEKYRRQIADFLSSKPLQPLTTEVLDPTAVPTIEKLASSHMHGYVATYYVKNGRATSEQVNIRQALRFARQLHGTASREFFLHAHNGSLGLDFCCRGCATTTCLP